MRIQSSIPDILDPIIFEIWIYSGYSRCSRLAHLTDEDCKDGDPRQQVQDVQHNSHLDKNIENARMNNRFV